MDGTRVCVAARSEVGRVRKISGYASAVTDLTTGRQLDPPVGTGDLEVGPRGGVLALSTEEARTSNREKIFPQAVGHADERNVAISRLKLRRGDLFLLCGDGLSSTIADEELWHILIGDDPAAACRRLDLSNEWGGTDKLTAAEAHVKGDGPPEPTPSESIARTLEVIPKSPGPACGPAG